MTDYTAARVNMVESQVRPNRVTDLRILTAMLELPRERFVGEPLRGIAYVDEDVPLGGGRYLTEPMVLARLVQAAQIEAGDSVLEIGTATGYGAALMARLARQVIAVESDPALARRAETTLRELGIGNVSVVTGPLNAGEPRHAPYDAIIISGAVQHVPQTLLEQLADEGRLAAVVAAPGEPGRATVFTKIGGAYSRRVVFDAGSRLLPGFAVEPGFAF
jgi:protein-L-isoaspartate(D-aspartate) O-methyltransferase